MENSIMSYHKISPFGYLVSVRIMLFICLTAVSVFGACKTPHLSSADKHPVVEKTDSFKLYQLNYDLQRPDITFELEDELNEISGLSMDASEQYLWAVQDEAGIIYKLSVKDGSIIEKFPFWKDGDYEGITRVGNEFYIAKNTGTLYRVSHLGEPNQAVEKYNTFLSAKNNIEGLTFDVGHNRLLLACKGSPGIDGEEMNKERAVYAFNLDTMGLAYEPVLLVSLNAVREFMAAFPDLDQIEKLLEYFPPGELEVFEFSPSGISIQPLTGEIFILSSSKKLLIILSAEGRILYIEKLKKSIHPQPEGICFSSDGTMYLSSEGKEGKARIHKFSVKH
ncbi:MAG: SdiA-regulated domain-containing protein [Saprospiraceae bacterium]|nr:SdiA-regulated domain-containing protein [Saprospiraceae bacterium]MCB9324877.1 SdiA-regulated domain-containing protein [Lewinellaceae bacterium]